MFASTIVKCKKCKDEFVHFAPKVKHMNSRCHYHFPKRKLCFLYWNENAANKMIYLVD